MLPAQFRPACNLATAQEHTIIGTTCYKFIGASNNGKMVLFVIEQGFRIITHSQTDV